MTRNSIALIVVLLFVLLGSAHADSLTFRDGTTVKGEWVGLDGRQISFQVNGQIQTYPRSDVLKVTFSPEQSAAQPTQKVELGMTKEQVAAILGKPDRLLAEAGAKQIYAYKDSKVTFVDDKVTDVQ